MIEYLILAVTCGLLAFGAYQCGRRLGALEERKRCCVLCHQAMLKTMSPSVRWVWNGISSGKCDLPPAEGFIGEGKAS